jgi:hypothetical protein
VDIVNAGASIDAAVTEEALLNEPQTDLSIQRVRGSTV